MFTIIMINNLVVVCGCMFTCICTCICVQRVECTNETHHIKWTKMSCKIVVYDSLFLKLSNLYLKFYIIFIRLDTTQIKKIPDLIVIWRAVSYLKKGCQTSTLRLRRKRRSISCLLWSVVNPRVSGSVLHWSRRRVPIKVIFVLEAFLFR